MIFWLFISFMALGCCFATLYFAYAKGDADSASEISNQALYLQQKQALEEDFQNDKISKKALAIAETELARLFLQSNKDADHQNNALKPSSPFMSNVFLGVSILIVMGLSFGLYFYLGSPNYKDLPLSARQDAPLKDQSLEQLIARAEAKVNANPNDLRGWKVLAPIYRRLGRIDDATYAYRTILAAEPNSADAITELAEIDFIQAGRVVTAQAKLLFERAKALDPSIIKPQFYLALADFQQGDKQSALSQFNQILQNSPSDAPWRPVISQYVEAIENGENLQVGGTEKSQKPDVGQNEQILAMVEGLAQRLEDEPDDLEGWLRLIRSYKVLGNHEAYDKAVITAREQFKEDKDALADIQKLIEALK